MKSPFAARRCRSCYLPMRYDFRCLWWWCWLCDHGETDEWLDARPRWRQILDRLTGLDPS